MHGSLRGGDWMPWTFCDCTPNSCCLFRPNPSACVVGKPESELGRGISTSGLPVIRPAMSLQCQLQFCKKKVVQKNPRPTIRRASNGIWTPESMVSGLYCSCSIVRTYCLALDENRVNRFTLLLTLPVRILGPVTSPLAIRSTQL